MKQQEAGQTDAQADEDLSAEDETGREDQAEDVLLLAGRKKVVGVQPDGTADLLYEAGKDIMCRVQSMGTE